MLLLRYVSTVLIIVVCTTYGADVAIMRIRVESTTTALYTLTYSSELFQKFSSCVCEGRQADCIMKYDTSRQPDAQFLNVSPSGTWSGAATSCKYYTCRVNQSQGEVICEQQNPTNYLCSKDSLYQSVNISNQSSCRATCVTFVWTLNTEGLTSPYPSFKKCDNGCPCPATATAATMANTELISRMTSTHNSCVDISSSSLVSTTIKVNTSGDDNNDFSATIFGSVLGVTVIVVIVIAAVIAWRRRARMSKPPKHIKHNVNVRDSDGTSNNSESDVHNQQNEHRIVKTGPAAEKPMNQDAERKVFDNNNYLNCHTISQAAGQREHINVDKQKEGFSRAPTAALITKTYPTSEFYNSESPAVEYENYDSKGFHGYSNTSVTAPRNFTDTIAGASSASANMYIHNIDNSHNSYDHIIDDSNNSYNHITDTTHDSHYYDRIAINIDEVSRHAMMKQNVVSSERVYEASGSEYQTNVGEYGEPITKSGGSEFTYCNS